MENKKKSLKWTLHFINTIKFPQNKNKHKNFILIKILFFVMSTNRFQWQREDEVVLLFTRQHLPRYLTYNLEIWSTSFLMWIFFGFIAYALWNGFIWILFFIIFFLLGFSFYLMVYWRQRTLYITNKRIVKFTRYWLFQTEFKDLRIKLLQKCITKYNWFLDQLMKCWTLEFVWYWWSWEVIIHFFAVKYPEQIACYTSQLSDYIIENPDQDSTKLRQYVSGELRRKATERAKEARKSKKKKKTGQSEFSISKKDEDK